MGDVLFPIWLFQGMERMVAISVINLGTRLAILVGVFALVHYPEDALIYAALIGGGSVIAGLIGMVVSVRMFRLKLVRVSWSGIFATLKEGWVLFLSKASVSLYTAGNAFILGMLTNHTVVGYYSAAEKIVKNILGLLGPLSQALYPRFSKMAVESKEKAILLARKMLLLMGGVGFIISLGIFFGATWIVEIILGSQYLPSVAVIQVLSPIIFLIALSNVLGIQILFPFHHEKFVFLVVLGAAFLNIGLAIMLVPKWRELGIAMSGLVSETFVTLSYYVFVQTKVFRRIY